MRTLRPIRFFAASVLTISFLSIGFASGQVNGFGAITPTLIVGNSNSVPVGTNTPANWLRPISLSLASTNASQVVTGFTGNVYLSFNPTNLTGAALVGSWTGVNFYATNLNFNSAGSSTNPPVYVLMQAQTGTNAVNTIFQYGP